MDFFQIFTWEVRFFPPFLTLFTYQNRKGEKIPGEKRREPQKPGKKGRKMGGKWEL
jgi:hypothetical protein